MLELRSEAATQLDDRRGAETRSLSFEIGTIGKRLPNPARCIRHVYDNPRDLVNAHSLGEGGYYRQIDKI